MCPPSPQHCFHVFWFFFFSFQALSTYMCFYIADSGQCSVLCYESFFSMAMKGKNFPLVAVQWLPLPILLLQCSRHHCCHILEAAFLPASLNHTMHSSILSAIEHPPPHLVATRVPLWKIITSQPHGSSLGWDCLSFAQVMMAVAPVFERELKEFHINHQDP